MTTTLRPTGPEERLADGARTRSYEVRVNGAAAGAVELSARETGGVRHGRIERLEVAEPHRRAGRGTVAALAAEEALRAWDCTRAEVRLRPDAEPALRLAAALGYTELSRNMVKPLDGGPADGTAARPGTVLRPLAEEEYPQWLAGEREGFVAAMAERGVRREQALAHAESAFGRLLPDGPRSADTALRLMLVDGERAGSLWVSTADGLPDDSDGYVFAVEVDQRFRGRGLGRVLMLDAESMTRAAGGASLGLHVFSGNTPALRLYESLGYRVTWLNQVKQLG